MANPQRKLSPAEQKRREYFEQQKAEMEAEGYTSHTLTVSIIKANVIPLAVGIPFIIISVIVYATLHFGEGEIQFIFSGWQGLAFVPIFMILVVAHEFIHGATWAVFAKNGWKSIAFGVIWHMLTPYCTCNEVLGKWAYICGGMMPTILLGVIPYVAFMAMGNSLLGLFISLLMILSGSGDILMTVKMLQFKAAKGKEVVFIDHPYELGMVALVAP